jgi:hypothetical protein
VLHAQDHITGIQFTTNYRVCKWLGEDGYLQRRRVVNIAPIGREIVGIFSSTRDKFYQVDDLVSV